VEVEVNRGCLIQITMYLGLYTVPLLAIGEYCQIIVKILLLLVKRREHCQIILKILLLLVKRGQHSLACCVNYLHHNSSLTRLILILVHTTGSS
jgi:hypothetical protein